MLMPPSQYCDQGSCYAKTQEVSEQSCSLNSSMTGVVDRQDGGEGFPSLAGRIPHLPPCFHTATTCVFAELVDSRVEAIHQLMDTVLYINSSTRDGAGWRCSNTARDSKRLWQVWG